jgi:hypothetical protein
VARESSFLVVVPTLDLARPFGRVPALWGLLKGLWSEGATVLVLPLEGTAPETPWWEALAPAAPRWPWERRASLKALEARLEAVIRSRPSLRGVFWLGGDLAWLKDLPLRLGQRHGLAQTWLDLGAPLSLLPLRESLAEQVRLLGGEDGASALAAAAARPAFSAESLPQFNLVVTPSQDSAGHLQALGARQVLDLPWGADPDLFTPQAPAGDPDLDLLFVGRGEEGRAAWMRHLVYAAAADSGLAVALAGEGFHPAAGSHPRLLGWVPPSRLPAWVGRSRVQAVVSRAGQAAVPGSPSPRLFELAALEGCCLCTPLAGLERFFEPGREVAACWSPAEVPGQLSALLKEPHLRRDMGRRARARVLDEHTMAHRARRLLRALQAL